MNIKLSVCLMAISSILYGCSTTSTSQGPPPIVSNPVITEDGNKVIGDGTHILGLPMTRDFIMNSSSYSTQVEANYNKAMVRISEEINSGERKTKNIPDKKIFSIKPVGDTKPRAVILLKKLEITKLNEWTIRKKNITVCEGFMTLPEATPGGSPGSQQVRDNEVITFMPVNSMDKKEQPLTSKNCKKFIDDKNGYDYASALQELNFILDGRNIGRSPFVAIYESPTSPYSSMILSLGELHPNTIAVMSKNWPELVANVYQYGNNIDPVAGIATMLLVDPKLQQGQHDGKSDYLKILVTGATCAGVLSTAPISLGTLITIPACGKLIKDTADAFGYTIPEYLSKILNS